MRYMTKHLAILVALAGLGCATTGVQPDAPRPTHRWVAAEDVSRAKYKLDNHACIEQSAVQFHAPQADSAPSADGTTSGDAPSANDTPADAASGKPAQSGYLDKSEPEFARYEHCMNQRGYNLASY